MKGDLFVNRSRHDKSIIIVGVLADQIYPSRRATRERWRMMKYVRKMVIHLGHEILKQDIYCQLIIYLRSSLLYGG